jgi:GT2 family glycosyltransferase
MTATAAPEQRFPPPALPDEPLPHVAIVVVHWTGIEDTIECLASLDRVDYPALTVILIDNGSLDFDERRVRETLSRSVIVASDRNLGFSGGYNLGIARALDQGADLVFLLNNDTVVSPDLVWSLLPALREPDVGIVGPVIQYYDVAGRTWFAGGGYSRLLGSSYRCRPLGTFDGHRPVDWINGCAMLVRRQVFEVAGPLWEPFFLNYEDVDFCLTAAESGYRCLLVGNPLVRHKVSASGGIRGTDRLSPDKAYYFARNSFHLLRRHASGLGALTGTIGQLAVAFPFWALHCLVARNVGSMYDYLDGMRDGILGRTGPRPRTIEP